MTRGVLPTGSTHLLAIVGHPVDQVLAPSLWTDLFRSNGLDAICLALHVLPSGLREFLRGLREVGNLDGLIVTVPHKVAALSLVDHVTDRARRIGAVNSIRKDDDGGWLGDMLDGNGFVRAFEEGIRPVRGQRTLVVGSGGAGAAIAFALADGGATEVDVADVDSSRAGALAERLVAAGTASRAVPPVARGYDLVVNASPAGMRPSDPLPIDLDGVTREVAVADVVTKPAVTRLIEEASARGCQVQQGLRMTMGQIPLQASFFGYAPDEWTVGVSNDGAGRPS